MDASGDDDPTSAPSFRFRWDVFLSFRGEDTRHNFTEDLYRKLQKHGVRAFRDDEELQRGEEIAPSLLDAIEDSAAAIAVISKRYADSRWCLEELARILECKRFLLPVFYQVDPSDVRKQKGPFEKDFRILEERFGVDKVLRWRNAMEKAGGISGWHSQPGEEHSRLIETLVKKVLTKLSNSPLGIPRYPVGLDSRLQELMRLLDINGNGVKFLGIYGMGGAGKTTLAKALFNKIVMHFKRRSFISSVKETSHQKDGLASLQKRLIHDLSSNATPHESLREIIHEEPVLIVLDDIDDAARYDPLIGKRHWYYEGSRIIITTRDKQTMPDNIVDVIYEMNGLGSHEALQLFSYHAFGREKPLSEFADISEKIVHLTGNLPLALEVFGSSLFHKRKRNLWLEALQSLGHNPPGLQKVLEISFNELDDQQKCAFLDIACFFIKMKSEDVGYILKGYVSSSKTLIVDLAAKSLVKIVEGDIMWMHDLLRDMGRQIVRRESPDNGMRSRLWDHDDVLNVLKHKKGTRRIQGIALDLGKNLHEVSTRDEYYLKFQMMPTFTSALMYMKEIYKNLFHSVVENVKDEILCTRSFKQMINLRLLQINGVDFKGSFKYMPPELKFLQWKGCHLKNLPEEFCMQNCAVLDLSDSKITKLWEQRWYNLHSSNKRAERLLVINLQNCYRLTDLPDFSVHPALEKLILTNCKALVRIHNSVGDLQKLIHLNLENCSELIDFPSDVSGLKHLEILNLCGCLKVKELPEDMRSMKCLRELLIDDTAIVQLPDSIFHLKKLERFSLKGCKLLRHLPVHIGKLSSLIELSLDGSGLEELPETIGLLPDLEILSLRRCYSLTALPDSIGKLTSLVDLFLNSSSVIELPESTGALSHLKNLSVSNCRSLSKLPDSIGGLASLVGLWLDGIQITEIPNEVGSLSMLERLYMENCVSLRFLPESIAKMLSITTLVLNNSTITELPESIGMLEKLNTLYLNKCKQLQLLPPSIGNLKSLRYFYMLDSCVSKLPNEIGGLSSLLILKMGKDHTRRPQNTASSTLPVSLSNLYSLVVLDARAWKIIGEIPDELGKLASLQELQLSHNNFHSLPSTLRDLSILKDLVLAHCKQLKSLPILPSSLVRLNVANCIALESISDLSNLENLQDFDLTNCNRIMDVPGLECCKSLRRLFASGCIACSPAIKNRLSKVGLKRLFNLSIPGKVVPDWFVEQIPRFATPKNRDIKGIIIGVVISLDQQTTDRFRDKLPAIVDIQAKVLRVQEAIYTTTLKLIGVPNTNEDQLYLSRYPDFRQLVLMLKQGDKLEIAMREKPYFDGLRLKKYGIHLIFENDDDFDDDEDEESLDESQRSVSWKLANFIGSLE
ncbi:disease resistance protein RPV1 [Euphorbia lathyris]|uniref:disease resistance protein RPV1 n=1 Tax=Euphorbia lathyris TaxID=212925 RepID=UPI003313941A